MSQISNSRMDYMKKNTVKSINYIEVPQQPDLISCGLFVMAFMHKFVDLLIAGKDSEVSFLS